MQNISKRQPIVCFLVTALLIVVASPGFAAQEEFVTQVQQTIERFQTVEPRTTDLFQTAYAYVVFPRIEKGAAGIGAASGDGLVFENGRLTGSARMSQVSLGVQVGGGTYAQVIFFENRETMNQFLRNDIMATSQATLWRAEDTESVHGSDRPGLLVFTMGRTGVFAAASAGAERVSFCPFGQ